MSRSLKLFGGSAVGTVVMLTLAVNFADRNIAPMPENPDLMAALPAPVAPAAPAGGLIGSADAATGSDAHYGLGRPALPEELAAWDLDVSPDGTGLPDGSGSVADGEVLFAENCAACHGVFAEGVGNWPKLAGGEGTLADDDPVKTVGSYWPYLSTVWDYVNRSMPFGNAQSLTPDEVYAITAYILYSNWLVEDDFVLSKDTFAEVEMPNADNFIVDDRAETEYTIWRTEPCMSECKDSAEITMRATVLDVTPEEEGAVEEAAATTEAPAATETAETSEPEAPAETVTVAAIDEALAAEGEKVFRKCKACHQVGDGAKNRSGPQLNGIVGRAVGSADGFKYSSAMSGMGGVWDEATLAGFLADPRGAVKGTKMAFAGLKSDEDIAAVTEYLKTFAE
ncbi:c-type cytochrome [Aestuariicoccus sp. MJ-SS9]|uniref:c-type cytochrome n=1 Tax=Aestuariicoccus sp. MJ-SS9 TaxID=3079855 RepID=UPI002907BD94|nr:c-type cytochrome [Aestuariicoccus sp. MJ-SS9]MDU8911195.1 c-type cytochrome [Aestuariicoccus sp. MJ-SS9]